MAYPFFKHDEIVAFEAAALRHCRAKAAVPVTAPVTIFLIVVLAAVGFVEYSLFHEIFSNLKGAAQPGEAAPWSINTLAATGLAMMLGFHTYADAHPSAFVVRVIERCAGFFLPVYALGAGLAVASVIYFDGADALVAQGADASRDLFSADEASAPSPVLERVIGAFPVVFALGCGGLAVVNLFVGHRLLGAILGRLRKMAAHWRAGSEARAAITVIRESQKQHAALMQQRDALLAMDQKAHETAVAHEIVTTISAALHPYETFLMDQQVRGGSPDNRFAIPQTNLEPKEVAKRVMALRSINVKSILAALRGGSKE